MPLATGSNFVRGRLADRGHAVRNLDRLTGAGNPNRLASWRACRHQRFNARRYAAAIMTGEAR